MDSNTVANALMPDEKLVWAGQPMFPYGWIQFVPVIIAGMIFAAGGGTFVFASLQGLSHGPQYIGIGLFGLVFTLIGLCIMVSPWTTKNAAKKTYYAITDKRILIIDASGSRPITQAYDRQALSEIDGIRSFDRDTRRRLEAGVFWLQMGATPKEFAKSRFTIEGKPVIGFENLPDPHTVRRVFESSKFS